MAAAARQPSKFSVFQLGTFLLDHPTYASEGLPIMLSHLHQQSLPTAEDIHQAHPTLELVSPALLGIVNYVSEYPNTHIPMLLHHWPTLWRWVDVMVDCCTVKKQYFSVPFQAAALGVIDSALVSSRGNLLTQDIVEPVLKLWVWMSTDTSLLDIPLSPGVRLDASLRICMLQIIEDIADLDNLVEPPQNSPGHVIYMQILFRPEEFAQAAVRHLAQGVECHMPMTTLLEKSGMALAIINAMSRQEGFKMALSFSQSIPLALKLLSLCVQQPFEQSKAAYAYVRIMSCLGHIQTALRSARGVKLVRVIMESKFFELLLKTCPWIMWADLPQQRSHPALNKNVIRGILEAQLTPLLLFREYLRIIVPTIIALPPHSHEQNMGPASSAWRTLIQTALEYERISRTALSTCMNSEVSLLTREPYAIRHLRRFKVWKKGR